MKIVKIILVIIGVGLLWYFVSPLFLSKEVNDELPYIPTEEEVAQMSAAEMEEMKTELEAQYAAMDPVMVEESMPAVGETSRVVVSRGAFVDGDDFHQGSGDVFAYENFIRFEDLDVTNGPDLRVYLVKNNNPENHDDIGEEGVGFIELGKLKGNMGNQNYELPEGVDVSEYGSVVIYCKPFRVIFAKATLN